MKKLVFAVGLAAAMTASAELKVGTVDLMLLVRNHSSYESNKTLLSATEKDYQRKLDGIKSAGEQLQEEGKGLAEQIRNPMLTPKAKGDIESQLREIEKKLMGFEQQYRAEALRCRQDLQDLEGRLMKTTTGDLRKRIVKYAEENDYDFIFDQNAAPFAKKQYDLTDELLKAMGVDPKDAKGRGDSADEGK